MDAEKNATEQTQLGHLPRKDSPRRTGPQLSTIGLALVVVIAVVIGVLASGGTPPGKNGSYASTEELLIAMEAAGVPCEKVTDGVSYGSVVDDSSNCTYGDEPLSLLTFEDTTARDDWMGPAAGDDTDVIKVAGRELSVVVGVNWIIMTPDGVNQDVAEEIRSALESGPS